MKTKVAAVLAFLMTSPSWASYHSGVVCLENNDFECAVAEFLPVAEQGNTLAQYFLGLIYLNQYQTPPSKNSAMEWLERSGEGGQVLAQTELARIYKDGDGVAPDRERMAKWYGLAAENGDVGAQLMIADHYAKGLDGHSDLIEAYYWYSIAINYWGKLAVHARKRIEDELTTNEIADVLTRSQAWLSARGLKPRVTE